MSKTGIRISNRLGTVTNEYDSQDLRVTIIEPSGAEVIAYHTEGQGNAPAADTSASGNVASASNAPVGPRDQFTRPWRPGDRNPTGEEMMFKPDWYLEYGKDQPQPERVQGGGPSATVGFVPGGIVKIGYPQGNQKQTRVTGCAPGLVAYDIGPVLLGKGPGTARVSIAQESSGDSAGRFNVATEPGVDSGASVLKEYEGNMPVFSIPVTADMPRLYVNARYTSVSANQLVQVEAHDRV